MSSFHDKTVTFQGAKFSKLKRVDKQLIILHKNKGDPSPVPGALATWSTCLRDIVFLKEPIEGEVYSGAKAYGFLLQIICGLKSNLLGETEVVGQFKKFLELNPQIIPLKVQESLLHDSKLIRTEHLRNLGSRTYGSLIKRYLQGHTEACVIGAGQLFHELRPWLEGLKIHLLVRDPQKVKKQYLEATIAVHDLSYRKENVPLIVAAPVENGMVIPWLKTGIVIDFRSGESGIEAKANYISLCQLFESQPQNDVRLDGALEAINQCTMNFESRFVLRPFGWDDICA